MFIMILRIFKAMALTGCFLCVYQVGFAQITDTVSAAISDSGIVKPVPDNVTVKDNHFKTAGKVFRDLALSVPGDFSEMGKEVSVHWKRSVAYTAGVGLLILADKPVTRFHQDVVEKYIDYKLPSLPSVKLIKGVNLLYGIDLYLAYPLGALYAGSLAANYKTGQRASLNSFKAMAYSYIITQIVAKSIFARQRPDLTLSNPNDPLGEEFSRNPYDFFNFRPIRFEGGGYATSFPSFHATAYYAVAKVLAMEFNNYWIPYSAVTIVFLSSLRAHQHWVSDMVAGGLLGTVIGHGVVMGTRRLEKRRSEKIQRLSSKKKPRIEYSIIPSISFSGVGVNLHASF
ncbi:hypothetical protein DC498_15930 [Terrimonas sp.]|nr:hypothetical protein DC498_15930 [Terrimonas sp.]